MWKHADKSLPQTPNPTICGWNIENNQYRIKWFDGAQIPDNVGTVIDETNADDSDEKYDCSQTSYDSDDEPDVHGV